MLSIFDESQEELEFFHMFFGSMITGRNRERLALFMIGDGNNGKGLIKQAFLVGRVKYLIIS